MKRKFLVAGAVVAILAIAGALALVITSSGNPPSGVFIDKNPAKTTTRTITVPPPPPTTVTVTETPRPTVTAETIKPPPPPAQPQGCEQNGLNSAGWDTNRDTPSAEELELEPGSPLVHPMVDAPLVEVSAWSGPCFDTVMFTVDTPLIPDINNPEVGDRMWFDGSYETTITDEANRTFDLVGDGDLRLTIAAPGDYWRYGDPNRPVQPVVVWGFTRTMGDDFPAITEVKGVSDFEGQVVFGIGVDKQRPFAVHFAENDGRTAVVVRVVNH